MNSEIFINREFNNIRNQIIDFGLIIATILGFLAYGFSLLKIAETGLRISYFTDLAVVLSIFAITVFRKKISLNIKSVFILTGLFIVFFIDLFQLGLLSANKVVIVLIPFFALLIFPVKRAILVLGIAVAGFTLAGYLTVTGKNPLLYTGPTNLTHPYSWIINLLLLLIVASLILIASHRYSKTYLKLLKDYEYRNKLLAESEARYKALMESMNEVIIVTDNNHKVQYVNNHFTEQLGYLPEDILGKDGYKILHDPEDLKHIEHTILRRTKHQAGTYELKFKTRDGRKLDFLVSGAPYINAGGEVIGTVGAMMDITEKKVFELELENYRNQLEKLVKERTEELEAANEEMLSTNEELSQQKEELTVTFNKLKETQKQLIQQEKMASLGVLTAGVGHEINNPLNFIQAGIYSIENYIEDHQTSEDLLTFKENIKQISNQMQIGVDRITNIVKGLKHFSRQTESWEETCNIHDIIDNCLLILYNQFKHLTEIKKNYAETTILVKGNEGKLHQVFMNIIINAIHAIEKEGIIHIETSISHSNASIVIEDNGTGISPEHLPRIFDPFFTTREAGKGTGLGLSIVYGVLNEHKGSIEIKSEKGKGTKAIILLPLWY